MRLKRLFLYILILALVASPVLGGYGYYGYKGYVSRDPSLIFEYTAKHHLVKDRISGTAWSQTYAGTNRNRINPANLMEAVAANTVVVDYVNGGVPMVRLEPAAANILLEVLTDWTDTTLTPVKNAVSWAGAANGAYTVTASGANGTLVSTAVSATSAAFTFVVAMKRSVGTGAVSMTIDNGATWTAKTLTTSFQYFNVTKTAANPQLGFKLATSGDAIIVDCLVLVPNTALASSYFAPAAAIGDELVVNGNFTAVVDNTGELSSGVLTVGNCYLISAHTDTDFTLLGAPDSNVGTYFNATATGADGILDAGDKVFPVTLTNWTITAGRGVAPQAVAGVLTGKVQKIASAAQGEIFQGDLSVDNVYRSIFTITLSAGTSYIKYGSTAAGTARSVSGTYTEYGVALGDTTVYIIMSAAFVGTIDDVSVMKHGTVRITEANTISLAMPAVVATALAATGTLVVDWMPSYARAAGVATNILAVTGASDLLYISTAAGNLNSYDGTTAAASTAAYTANVLHRLALQWPSSANKFKVGASVAMAGVAWGAEANFDGAFATGGNLVPGWTVYATMWIKSIRLYNKLLTDAQVNALP